MLTADTITDEQIRELREQLYREDAHPVDQKGVAVYIAISKALHNPCWGYTPNKNERAWAERVYRAARARCAEILNARAKEGR